MENLEQVGYFEFFKDPPTVRFSVPMGEEKEIWPRWQQAVNELLHPKRSEGLALIPAGRYTPRDLLQILRYIQQGPCTAAEVQDFITALGPPYYAPPKTPVLLYPLDKVNAEAWQENPPTKVKTGEGLEVEFWTRLRPDAPRLPEGLNADDKIVYYSIASCLWDAEQAGTPQRIVTINQIHNKIGHTGKPTKEIKRVIQESIDKMRHTDIYLNNTPGESGANYPIWRRKKTYLLHAEWGEYLINGRYTDGIRILSPLPLEEFARGRKQITQVDNRILKGLTIGKFSTALTYDYIIQRVKRMGHGADSNRILWCGVYKASRVTPETGAKRRKQMFDARERTIKVLEECKTRGDIVAFKADSEGVNVTKEKDKSNDL